MQKKKGGYMNMLKKAMFMGVLCLMLMTLLPVSAFAWNIPTGGWVWGSYQAWFELRGGQKPGTITTFLASEVQVNDAALVCTNPGRWRQDVRQGMGGLTIIQFISSTGFRPFDDRGRFLVDQEFPYNVVEFAERIYDGGAGPSGCNPDQSTDLLYTNCPAAFEAFNEFYHVSSADCRNDNWVPWAYLIQNLDLTGTILEDCSDPSNPSFDTCTPGASLSLQCMTDESYRTWGEDGRVDYICIQ